MNRYWLVYYKTANSRRARDRNHYHFLDVLDDLPPEDLEPTTLDFIDGDDIWIEGSSPYLKTASRPRWLNDDKEWWRDSIGDDDDGGVRGSGE